MPKYQYRCADCAHVFTVNKSITDDSYVNCPVCESIKVIKLFNNVKLKGNAFGNVFGGCSGGCSKSSCSDCGH